MKSIFEQKNILTGDLTKTLTHHLLIYQVQLLNLIKKKDTLLIGMSITIFFNFGTNYLTLNIGSQKPKKYYVNQIKH